MDIIIEILRNLPPRFSLFIFALLITASGVYGWQTFRTNVNLYDAAKGKEGRTIDARVYLKGQEMGTPNSKGASSLSDYFLLTYDLDGEHYQERVYVSTEEFQAAKEDDLIKISVHPKNPKYIVTPKATRPSALGASIVCGFAVVLGLLLAGAVIISAL